MYCGFCERFGCEYDAKAEPNNTFIPVAEKTGNCEIRCNANVVEILKKGNKVTGVRYIDTLTLEEFIQPADVAVLSSYVMNNAKLLMVSKIGKQYDPKTGQGTLGRGYCYQITPGATLFFEEPILFGRGWRARHVLRRLQRRQLDHSDPSSSTAASFR